MNNCILFGQVRRADGRVVGAARVERAPARSREVAEEAPAARQSVVPPVARRFVCAGRPVASGAPIAAALSLLSK